MVVAEILSTYVSNFQVTDQLRNQTVTEDAGYCNNLLNGTLVLTDLPGAPDKTMTRCAANLDFYSMQYSLLINVVVVGIGALFFFLTAIWVTRDKMRAENPEMEANVKNANAGETKEMLGVMEMGGLEDSIDSDDIPPTMIISKSEIKSPVNQSNYDQRFSTLQLNQAMEEYSPTGRRAKPDSTFIPEERKSANNSGYQQLNTASAISKFQRLLDSPDTSNERLYAGNISNSSSSSPSPATPKSLHE